MNQVIKPSEVYGDYYSSQLLIGTRKEREEMTVSIKGRIIRPNPSFTILKLRS